MRIRHWLVALYALISVLALAAIPLSAAGSNAALLWLLGWRVSRPWNGPSGAKTDFSQALRAVFMRSRPSHHPATISANFAWRVCQLNAGLVTP